MKNKLLLSFLLSAMLLLTGCSTNVAVKKEMNIAKNTPFSIGQIENTTGINPENQNSIQLMKDAMTKALNESALPIGEEGYKIDVIIKEYEEGNAFKRWLMPGWGATKLTVQCILKHKNDHSVGEIEVSRSIAAGGGYTVGAGELVFSDVARAIVEDIKNKI